MKAGQRAQIVRVHPVRGLIDNSECVKAVLGRIIVVTEPCIVAGFPAWFYGPLMTCPLSTTSCKFGAFLEAELQPLPPEEDCIDPNEVDIELPIVDYSDLHLDLK